MAPHSRELLLAADAIGQASSIIVTAGAGMGVDSGLPDFRGKAGFWKAYPLYRQLGLDFTELANPRQFSDDPYFAWGFYGHRANMYRTATPHAGFGILRKWIELFELESFVVTSNVDGQFQKAGFDEMRIVEVHGSIHHVQCHEPCSPETWVNDRDFDIDPITMRCLAIPSCLQCSGTARPNILMFNDWSYIPVRSNLQEREFEDFVAACAKPLVVVELGAGKAIPTIRWTSEKLGRHHGATVIRINPFEPEINSPHISLPITAADGLQAIDQLLTCKRTR